MAAAAKPDEIVVIEDDAAQTRLIKALLEAAGHRVHSEAYGANALAYVAEHPPALVVLDIKLPDINGYDICRQLRQIHHPWDMPVLMVTGMDKPVDQLRGFAFGADAYMTKPFSPPEFLRTVQLLLGDTAMEGTA
jgi:DNA-binding response OmpR family regulator